jgi:hypothetical protein
MWRTTIERLGRVVKIAGLLFVLSVGGALAAEPVFQDCLEGAGDDLQSVSLDDIIYGPPPPPPPTS